MLRQNPSGTYTPYLSKGLPPALASLLSHVCEQDQQYIQLGTDIGPQPATVTTSLPQGDALCPAALNILLPAVARHVHYTFRHQVIFIDDRTILCNNLATLQGWNDWYTLLALSEHFDKTTITNRNSQHRKQLLQRAYRKYVKPYTRVLLPPQGPWTWRVQQWLNLWRQDAPMLPGS